MWNLNCDPRFEVKKPVAIEGIEAKRRPQAEGRRLEMSAPLALVEDFTVL